MGNLRNNLGCSPRRVNEGVKIMGDGRRLRSEVWFNDLSEPAETAIYLERLGAYGLTRDELQSGRPIIGIAQSGSDISPCNKIHLSLSERFKAGVRDAGGVPLEFPVHPIQETIRRPTAALDRNLQYLGLVEIIAGYPFDGVILTTGCDKTTPAQLMAVATTDLPAIVFNGGPMLDGYYKGRPAPTGVVLWEARRQLSAGEMDEEELLSVVMASASSLGHCNSMGTALTMNSLAESLGMTLPGASTIPAPYAQRSVAAYRAGQQIVAAVHEDLTPSRIMTKEAFTNAIVVASAIGASTNAPIHINAIAAHLGVDLSIEDWDEIGRTIPLLANVAPSGEHQAEAFHRAGGIPAIMRVLLDDGLIDGDALTINGATIAENVASAQIMDPDVIHDLSDPLLQEAGFTVLSGNLFDSAILKASVISPQFRQKYLSDPKDPEAFEVTAIVFDGPEDYRARIEDPALQIDERSMLVVRGAGPVGYPGGAEVVNMTPPGYLVREGHRMLPCLGDGRQSGTSDSPSILNIAPEAAVGGRLAILQTGDRLRIDLVNRRVDLLLSEAEIQERMDHHIPEQITSNTPWEELFRTHVTQFDVGATLDFATKYRSVKDVIPRHSH